MNTKLKCILLFLFCCQIKQSISQSIVVDSSFSSVDIYNPLLNKSQSYGDIVLNISITNKLSKEQQLYLSIINPTIDKIIINDGTQSVILGDLVRFTKREFKHINHVYPITLKANETKKYTLRVLKQWQSLNFRVNLASQNTFIKTTNHDDFFLGVFYGILFMYLLVLICFYIFSKNNFFIIYLSINGFMLLLLLQYSGVGYQYVWFYSTTVQKYISLFLVIAYFTAHPYFIRNFFTLQFSDNFTRFISKSFLIITVFFSLLMPIHIYNRAHGHLHTNIYYLSLNSILLLYGLMVIALCIYTYVKSRRRETIWVLIDMLLHISGWMIFINNEYAMFKPLNYIDNIKLFDSNIFIPQINFLIILLEVFVVTIFIAINYYKLIKQNNVSAKRLEFLQKRNINTFVLGQEAEREKISDQIEITVSNDIRQLRSLLLNYYQLDEKRAISTVLNDIDKTLEDINNITSNYVAPNMQKMILTELIITATEKIYALTNLQYDFTRIPVNFQLNALANINLFRTLQEISNNILKHANATNVTISTIKDSKTLQIKIIDDGVGFANLEVNNKGIGLMNIESRMDSLNGSFYVLSNIKKGSTIHLLMPLKDII